MSLKTSLLLSKQDSGNQTELLTKGKKYVNAHNYG